MSKRDDIAICDHTPCGAPADYVCECDRCAREDDLTEKYHACNAHKTDVKHIHFRVRGRSVEFVPLPPREPTE